MLGNKVTLHRSVDSGTVYGNAIADVFTLEVGEKTAETVESTTYGAATDYKAYDYGLKDGGEYTATIRYSAGQTDADAFEDALDNSTKEYLQLQFPAPISQTISFVALVTKVGYAVPKEGKIERMFTFKVDGEPLKAAVVVTP